MPLIVVVPVMEKNLISSKVFLVNTLENEGFHRLPNGRWIYEENGKEFDSLMDAYLYYLEVI